MNNNNENEALVSEFSSLRNEILEHQSRREKLFLYTISALGVVLAFLVNSSNVAFVIVSFVPYFLIYNFCHSVEINSIHIVTMGTYIRNFISSEYEKAYRWEVIWDKMAKRKEKIVQSSNKGEYWKGGGYWFNFAIIASILTCLGISYLAFSSKNHFTGNLLEKVIFISVHVGFCGLTLYFGARKIHWGKLNRKTRTEKNATWEKSKTLLEENQVNQ